MYKITCFDCKHIFYDIIVFCRQKDLDTIQCVNCSSKNLKKEIIKDKFGRHKNKCKHKKYNLIF